MNNTDYQLSPREQRIANTRRKNNTVQRGGAKRLVLLIDIERKRLEETHRKLAAIAASTPA